MLIPYDRHNVPVYFLPILFFINTAVMLNRIFANCSILYSILDYSFDSAKWLFL